MAHREDTLNRRLGLLTILSSIFMPLTLLSGKNSTLSIDAAIAPSQWFLMTLLRLLRNLGHEL
jgi:hypothetical protein